MASLVSIATHHLCLLSDQSVNSWHLVYALLVTKVSTTMVPSMLAHT